MKEFCKKRVLLDIEQIDRNPGLVDAVLEDAKKAVMMEVLQKLWQAGESIVSFRAAKAEDPELQARGMSAVMIYGIREPIVRCMMCTHRPIEERDGAEFVRDKLHQPTQQILVYGFSPDSKCPFRANPKM